jgi:hypothetical protein
LQRSQNGRPVVVEAEPAEAGLQRSQNGRPVVVEAEPAEIGLQQTQNEWPLMTHGDAGEYLSYSQNQAIEPAQSQLG